VDCSPRFFLVATLAEFAALLKEGQVNLKNLHHRPVRAIANLLI